MRRKRSFSKEFKRDAVTMANQEGVTVIEVAQELGIAPKLIYNWRKAFRLDAQHAFPGSGHQTPEIAEISRLKAENARLKMERDILKKAMRVIVGE